MIIKELIVYTKITLLGLIAILLALVAFKNRSYKTRFWPLADQEDVATLWLMLGTAGVSIVTFWICMKLKRVFREAAEIRLGRQQEAILAGQKQREQNLAAQERRIDDKLRQAVGESVPKAK